MTEKEAIRFQEAFFVMVDSEKGKDACKMAIEALKKVQEYRKLGTVEEVREVILKSKAFEQVKRERDIAIGQLKEIGIEFGEKMDNVKEVINKSKPMKIVYRSDNVYNDGFSRYKEYYCPNCGEIYRDIEDYPYCHWCGQRLEV